MIRHLIILSLLSFTITGCFEKKTDNALKAYTYWAGVKPPDDIKVLNGSYWESSHWSKEYILFLKLKATKEWVYAFINQNELIKTTEGENLPEDIPNWYQPSKKSLVYTSEESYNKSKYYFDSATNIMYIYEIQL